MSKVESPAFAAGEFGTTPTTPTYPDFFDRIRPTSARFSVLVLQVLAILVGVQVAGERVDRFEQAVQSAQRDALHVRLFDVLALDVPDDVAEDADVLEGVVLARRPCPAPTRPAAEA